MKETFNFKISWLAILQFIETLSGNKDRKHLRDRGETAKQKTDWKNGGQMKRHVGVMRERKIGRLLTDQV